VKNNNFRMFTKFNLGRNLHVCARQPARIQDSCAAAKGRGGLQTRRVHDCQGNGHFRTPQGSSFLFSFSLPYSFSLSMTVNTTDISAYRHTSIVFVSLRFSSFSSSRVRVQRAEPLKLNTKLNLPAIRTSPMCGGVRVSRFHLVV
jgi:hypothetical protein